MTLHLKSILVNALVVAAAVVIGLPLGQFVHQEFFKSISAPQPTALTEEISRQQFGGADIDFVIVGDTQCSYCKEGVELLKEKNARYRVTYIDKEPQGRIYLRNWVLAACRS
jgi:hypothetical protein